MTELQRYLAGEVAEDHADGLISRREAFRRLGMLGIGATAAAALLVESGRAAEAAPPPEPKRPSPQFVDWAPRPTEEITFPGPNGTLLGSWAAAAAPRGAVLVMHENRGLTAHIREVVSRLAASGYSALALDLLSEEGGTAAFADDAAVAAALAQIDPTRFDADMKAAVTELTRRLPDKKIAAIGFCFGGGMVWRLLAAGEPRLSAAAPFYGPFPEGGDLSGSVAAVLGVYGGLDSRVNATRDAAVAALQAASLKHQILTFTVADHAFFNDTGARYNVAAAAEAWRRVIDWYDAFVGTPKAR
jgi:carboxymethylenebutenolidase